jgi:iron complex transport system substrate-binding protein
MVFSVRPVAAKTLPPFLAVFAALVLGGVAGCKDKPAREGAPVEKAAGATGAAAPRWARAYAWKSTQGATELHVTRPWKGAREPLRYALLPEGAAPPAGAEALRVPARRIVCLASVHVGFLRALGATDALIGVDAANHIYDSAVRAGLAAGTVFEAGSGSQLNIERLLAAKPDLVIANAVGLTENEALNRLRRAGIPVLVSAEWMEDHPLARAEWVRVFGAITGRARAADSLFAAIERSYLALADSAKALPRKPTVMIGAPYRDQWFVSGGRSYMARFLEDAGADYLWKDDTTAGGVPLSFETVLVQARDADAWLYPGDWNNHWSTLADGARQDARYATFKPFREARVYNNDARRLADGANDYWESGSVNPHLMLADFVSIFHGDSLRQAGLYYHRRLPRGR